MSSKTEYAQRLAGFVSGGPIAAPVEASVLAKRYAHLFFLRYHVPMGWTTSPLTPPYRLTIESLAELEPGRNPSLDEVCEGILEARQVLLPRHG